MKKNFNTGILKSISVLMCTALVLTTGCGSTGADTSADASNETAVNVDSVAETESENYDGTLVFDYSLETKYSERFGIDYYKGGYKVINTDDGAGNSSQFVIVPEGMSVPTEGINEDAVIICQPVESIMCSSAPTISLLNALGALDKVKLTTATADSWYIDEVKAAMESGSLEYVGESSAPDYEMITASGINFAFYSRSLTDDVKEQLANIGVDVLVDYSSIESEPMARVEWSYVFAALFDLEDKAKELVENQEAAFAAIDAANASNGSVAVFYITSKGKLYARNADDYMAKMVEYAGGEYALSDVGVGETGTINMEMEAFYEKANDADYIIYIWSTGGKPETLDDFLANSELLKDFKAVKEGNVWCTTPVYFQASNAIGDMVADINTILKGDATDEDLTYYFKLQ